MGFRTAITAAVGAGILLAAGGSAAMQAHGASAAGAQAETSVRDDLAALRRFLSEDKSYSVEARAAAETELARLEAEANGLSKAQLALGAARIAALADNGHTLAVNGIGGPGLARIPWRLMVLDGRLVVGDADEPGLIGAEVLSVGGAPVDAIRQAARRYRGGVDGWRDLVMPEMAEAPEALAAAGLIDGSGPVEIVVRDRTGAEARRTLTAVEAPAAGFFRRSPLRASGSLPTTPGGAPQPVWLRQQELPFTTAELPELDAFYVGLKQTNDAGPTRIRDWLTATGAEIDAKRPRNVVLDMRLNGGGDLNTARAFMKALPGRLPPEGKVFVLTSPRTFSAAISSIGYLKEAGGDRVVIVGEPVGDRLEFWAEGDIVELPWSGVALLFANERHNYQTGCQEEDCHGSIRRNPIRVASVQPDIAAPMTVEAWIAGRDPALEAIARYLGR